METAEIPPYQEFLLPAMRAVSRLGGSASISEMVETVVSDADFTDVQQAVLHKGGPETEIGYRLAWARTYLKGMGLLSNSQRGVWSLTDDGAALLDDDALTEQSRYDVVQRLRAEYLDGFRQARRDRARSTEPSGDGDDDSGEPTWKEALLDAVMDMTPGSFERLAKRLLREADFDTVNVTGGSGDGGIDGMGVYRLALVSFPVFF